MLHSSSHCPHVYVLQLNELFSNNVYFAYLGRNRELIIFKRDYPAVFVGEPGGACF